MEIIVAIIFAIVIWLIARTAMNSGTKKIHICESCHSQGRPKYITPGSVAIEIILWLFIIIPGLIYTLWRVTSRYKGCPVCGSKNVIPADTPKGQMILKSLQQSNPTQIQDTYEPSINIGNVHDLSKLRP